MQNNAQGANNHANPCPDLYELRQNVAVLSHAMTEFTHWQKRQNGALERLVADGVATRERSQGQHEANAKAISDLRWQMRLGFVALSLLLVSEHPLFTALLRLLGL